jgi:tetratricopeptide (TPR) repeat protein
MAHFLGGSWSILLKPAAAIIGSIAPNFAKSWKRWRFPAASSDRVSILVAKLSGDQGDSHHHSIRDAIRAAASGSVAVYNWEDELPIGAGLDEEVLLRAEKTARTWLTKKRCDLLISGRVKSSNVVSLTFTPAISDNSSSFDPSKQTQSYTLPIETMEFPAAFIADLGAAIAGCAVAGINKYHNRGFIPAIETAALQLETLLESDPPALDGNTKARLFDCLALARSVIFENTGRAEDLRRAESASASALSLIGKDEHPLDWAKFTCRAAFSTARRGELTGESAYLRKAAEELCSAVGALSSDPIAWANVQLNLSALYMQTGIMTGNSDHLKQSLSVLDHIITDEELLKRDEQLWAAAQHNFATALTLLGETEAGDDSLMRSFDVFTSALEVRTVQFPRRRFETLLNFSSTLISLGARQNVSNWFDEAIERLREAERLIPLEHAPRRKLLVLLNKGLALTLAGQEQPEKLVEAVRLLRQASRLDGSSPRISLRIQLVLAKALLLSGDTKLASEALEILKVNLEIARRDTPMFWGDTYNDLGLCYQALGTLNEDVGCLSEARKIFEDLCRLFESTSAPFQWIRAHQNLARTLYEAGKLEGSIDMLKESIEVLSRTFALISEESSPVLWVSTQYLLARSHHEIAKHESSALGLDEAQRAIAKAGTVLQKRMFVGSLSRNILILGQEIQDLIDERGGFEEVEPVLR